MPIIYYQRPLISKETIKAAVFFDKNKWNKNTVMENGSKEGKLFVTSTLFAMPVTFVIFFKIYKFAAYSAITALL